MLRRLGLLLSVDDGNVGNMDVDKVALAGSLTELGQGLNKGHALDITDGTSLEMVSFKQCKRARAFSFFSARGYIPTQLGHGQ